MTKKIYVIDTSTYLTNFKSIFSYGNNDIIVPLIVLEEVDRLKNRPEAVGANARWLIRVLDQLRIKAKKNKTTIFDGVRIRKGLGTLKTMEVCTSLLSRGYEPEIPDHQIIGTALKVKQDNPDKVVIVVSNDINMRVKCDAVGLLSEHYVSSKVVKDKEHIYDGHKELSVSSEDIDILYKEGSLETSESLYPNQLITLCSNTDENHKSLAIFDEKTKSLKPIKSNKRKIFGVEPKNKEQVFAAEILCDENIPVVSLTGFSGTGKTVLALAAGVQQVLEEGKYKRLIVSRPIQPMGGNQANIGFLPGDVTEKMIPWLMPILDNLKILFGNDNATLEGYIQRGIIEIEPLVYIRGRSIQDSYMILDESQQVSKHEMKTILTRIGHGSKIVCTGDIEQIDTINLDETTSGLTHLIEKFKTSDLSAHMTLKKGERSPVATLASKIL